MRIAPTRAGVERVTTYRQEIGGPSLIKYYFVEQMEPITHFFYSDFMESKRAPAHQVDGLFRNIAKVGLYVEYV